MTDINSSPVSLPAGSHDYDKLKKGLDAAAKGSDRNYQTAVEKALTPADPEFTPADPRDIAGYRFVDVENAVLGTTENIQVFDPKLGEKVPDREVAPPPAFTTPNGAVASETE